MGAAVVGSYEPQVGVRVLDGCRVGQVSDEGAGDGSYVGTAVGTDVGFDVGTLVGAWVTVGQ